MILKNKLEIALAIVFLLSFYSCKKDIDIVTYKVSCTGEYYLKYSNHEINKIVKTDTLVGKWVVDVRPNFTKEHIIKVYSVQDTLLIQDTIIIDIYLNDIWQNGIHTIKNDTNPLRFGTMVR